MNTSKKNSASRVTGFINGDPIFDGGNPTDEKIEPTDSMDEGESLFFDLEAENNDSP